MSFLRPHDTFVRRHVGPDATEVAAMLASVDADSLDALVRETVPADILLDRPLDLGSESDTERGEHELVAALRRTASKNRVLRSFIGAGYHGTIVPPVIQRNVLENPGWYTQYTPYQAEISQGRLEALLNFQTVVADLTGLPLAGASLLDEATAAAEAMAMSHRIARGKRRVFLVSEDCHPQTIAVVRTRADGLGIDVQVGDHTAFEFEADVFGVLLQYPASRGAVHDYAPTVEAAHAGGALVTVAADLLALVLLRPPGEFGADIAVGSTQRFGVPMGFGGPHAAYMSTTEAHKRQMPGRMIGVSKDAQGRPALRMAMQTREQHIRREKATSNICTAQVLLAVMAGMYAVYHGPDGLRTIAEKVHGCTLALRAGLEQLGLTCSPGDVFDTLTVQVPDANAVHERAIGAGINLRRPSDGSVGVSLDETVEAEDLETLWRVIAGASDLAAADLAAGVRPGFEGVHGRTSSFLEHPVFHDHRAEHELLRYMRRLEGRDLSLTTSMIPLGSCTMKLNGTSEMLPITWPEFGALHPFAPADQTQGYTELLDSLERSLAEITGFAAVSLQPNAGSQGEYAGLLAIRGFHRGRGEAERNVCLIPVSAHGTNPASAILAGMRVVVVKCDALGNIDVADLRARAEEHKDDLAALMVTYPSTHGVFEERIREICAVVHEFGGQVYLDGANMNAQVGLCRPGDYGADVCHLNLHKTFCIPHGGGGPGMGPIGVAQHLVPYLPSSPVEVPAEGATGAVSAAPYGSPSILPISWVYIELMGAAGLKHATEVAILSANYMAKRLGGEFEILYTNAKGRVAHEFILDLRPLDKSAGVTAEDVAKRLMDYGFHAPTVSFPVVGTMMIEPTESETQAELDRLCDALLSIRAEIQAIENGTADRADNPLKNAPHTAAEVMADTWSHPYSREQAAFPTSWTRESKFWPSVARIDNGYGDKNLICTCPPLEAYVEEGEVLQEA